MTDFDPFEDQEVLDFSEPKHETIKFRIDDDIFEAFAAIPAGMFMEHSRIEIPLEIDREERDPAKIMAAAAAMNKFNQRYFRFLDEVLLPESAERFARRLMDRNNPITMQQAGKVYRMLMGKYTGRPTQPPSPSQNGDGGTGDGSTVSVPTGGSTLDPSQPNDSPISSIFSESGDYPPKE